ncbi:hypothetical protein WCD74_11675 [Actinomycetospora sp. OC33-EN08]|uniref:Uncharacterized protein n=1 Tax=Actinomycetospora aurantiaca TaxID=3129233 RepID=A0ABU8MM93_9PSEU
MGRPKKFERTLKIAMTEEQWERLDLEAIIMRVPIAEAVRMNIEVGLNSTMQKEENSDA